jgi:hypothetical protein
MKITIYFYPDNVVLPYMQPFLHKFIVRRSMIMSIFEFSINTDYAAIGHKLLQGKPIKIFFMRSTCWKSHVCNWPGMMLSRATKLDCVVSLILLGLL